MRYAPERKAQTRARILRAAAELLRSRGIVGTGIDSVMARAGLTAGGFYGHFRSKDALVADAVDAAAKSAHERWYAPLEGLAGRAWAREFLRTYMSPAHRDARALGCILPTLGPEMPRASKAARQRFQGRLQGMLASMAERVGEELPVSRADLIAAVALSAGAVLLSRAVADARLSEEILEASRDAAERLLGIAHPPSRRKDRRA